MIVYILTNECMPDTIKIGITENLEQRMKQLDNTSVPLPFECFYAVDVEDAALVEKKMHQGLDDYRIRNNREFFNITPEKAKSLLEIAGGKDVTPSEDIVETPQDLKALENARTKRRRFNFSMLGIEKGTTLEFSRDRAITCEVFDDSQVVFRGKTTSLSASAITILEEMGYDWGRVRGPAFWCINGKTLNELRDEAEG
mgnify:FL=1